MAIDHIETLLGPDYLADLDAMPMGEVRRRRDESQEAADELSYLRRIIQGRLDIVHAEIERRLGGEATDIHELVGRLERGEILSESARPAGFGRLPLTLGAADADGWITRELDAVLDAKRVGMLNELPEEEVRAIADALGELERKVSDQRNALHERHDALQAEVVRRYRTGEASVDTLLR
jgi:hypothetical protein